MEHQKEYLTVTDGTYILSETDCPNEFTFYRQDGGTLGDVGKIPMEMYEWRMYQNMLYRKINEPIIESIIFERSRDDRCIMMTVIWYDMHQENEENNEEDVTKKERKIDKIRNFIKKCFY